MNARDRFLNALLFGEPDRIPLVPGDGRESTLAQWHKQGLPIDVSQVSEYAYRTAGGTLEWPESGADFPVNERMIPQFEEKIIEKRESTQIVQDWKGNICEISNEYSTDYLRNATDFVTRRWIRCPVESREDWRKMIKRYDSDEASRLPTNADALSSRLSQRTWPLEITLPGPFWQVREWTGFEGLCILFYEDPSFVADMIRFWEEYITRLLRRVLSYVVPDVIHFSEDMAYKGHSMISPDMVRTYLLPTYQRWGELIRSAGCPIFDVDSDGYIGELIPIWLDAGVNVCDPIEVAAGNDIAEFRKKFGRKMAYRGGVDKRAIAKGGVTIEREIQRLLSVVKSGGYIPGCDHGVPSDISWDNFVYYVRLLAATTGWLPDGG